MKTPESLRPLLALALALPAAGLAVLGPGASGAQAEANGVGLTPALGWSSWSYVRHDPTATGIEAQAAAMKTSGLAAVGYQYVNIDDFWYRCPGGQGPDVDQYGRWVTDSTEFPPSASGANGIQVVAGRIHKTGLKFGLYVTPGISDQAVAQNTPIEGTSYTAAQIANGKPEGNYNCGGMQGIDYSKPGAQQFIDSWADEMASWGIDYLKLDGVGTGDVGDVEAWSQALAQTGRPIHLELSNSLAVGSAATWAQYSNGWRTGDDIECYCGSNGSSYPLTDWSNVSGRFDQVAAWQPYGGPGAFNDYDSIEVGNGSNDGLTPDERQTQMSLWALGSSPFILGTDLTDLDPTDLSFLRNKAVLAVDQDAIDASRISESATTQVFAKTEQAGDEIVGLFNTSGSTETVSTTAAALGLSPGTYKLDDLWSGRSTETAGTIAAEVPSHGVALYKVTKSGAGAAPPDTVASISLPATVQTGTPFTATVSFTDYGRQSADNTRVTLSLPTGWSAVATSPTKFVAVKTGQTAVVDYQVTPGAGSGALTTESLTGKASYDWSGGARHDTVTGSTSVASPVQAPYLTYSSATDGPAGYGQSGTGFAIEGAGADLWTDADAYTTIYQPSAVSAGSTIETEVTAQSGMSGYAKAGIIVRNAMTASGTGTEGVILYESPSGGIQMEWNSDGDSTIDSVTPGNGTIADTVPVHLRLAVAAGGVYTGYYSTDGSTWTEVGTATVPGQNATQDAGLFMLSHSTGSDGLVDFSGFTVTAG
ncbi:MAG TPA: NEW3 domain-containing protein [Actinospica sp.]|nr:NEW3 domain-containing protein [Actinospica sp.]